MFNYLAKTYSLRIHRECYKLSCRLITTTIAKANSYQTSPTENDQNEPNELKQKHIEAAIKQQPLLASVSKEMWERTHEVFTNHGFPTKSFLQIIVKNPLVLSRSPQKNVQSIENWRSSQFGEKLLLALLLQYPDLLNATDERKILQRVTYLKGFAVTNKNVWKLLMSCPNVLEEREQSIEQKLDYMLKKMRVEIHEIVKSESLAKPFDEIRCRHVFLERLSLFTPRSLREDAKQQPSKNSRLTDITDTTDKQFAKRVAKCSLEEYEAFRELFAREMERKRRSEDGADDEDE